MFKRMFIFFMLAMLLGSCAKVQTGEDTFTILSSSENKDLEQMLMAFADSNKIKLKFEYSGSLGIAAMVEANQNRYDAVWSSNSIWNASLSSVLKNSKSISINPVIFAVTQSKYDSLGFSRNTVVSDLVSATEAGDLKFLMPSVTQTNSGASAYLGFLNCLAGNPPVLTEEDLESETLQQDLKNLFKGVQRNSGSDEYLIDIFKNGDYDAVVNYESSLIALNKQLQQEKKEPLMFIYPSDGVSVSDSPFAYVDNKDEEKLETFYALQNFLLSSDTQKELEQTGRRTAYGGLVTNGEVFKASYGIDGDAYLSPIKYPAAPVINKALGLYQDLFRKPSAVVFCLDYSGSMAGEGNKQLVSAMNKILDREQASVDLIQFAEVDNIFVIPFNDAPIRIQTSESGIDTEQLMTDIEKTSVGGGTDIYQPVVLALEILEEIDSDLYTKSIVLMTDGESSGRFDKGQALDIPVFSIMFGKAKSSQLDTMSELSNGKTFDGRTDLVNAFKEIRAYN